MNTHTTINYVIEMRRRFSGHGFSCGRYLCSVWYAVFAVCGMQCLQCVACSVCGGTYAVCGCCMIIAWW